MVNFLDFLGYLRRLRQLGEEWGMSLENMWRLADSILKLGLPPDVKNGEAFRDWVRDVLKILDEIATATVVEIDNQIVAFLEQVVESDDLWDLFYGLFLAVYNRVMAMTLESEPLAAKPGEVQEADIISQQTGFDWSLILKAVEMVIQLLLLRRSMLTTTG